LKLPAILRAPFARRGKKKTTSAGEDQPRSSSSSYEIYVGTPVDVAHPIGPSSPKFDNDDIPPPDSNEPVDVKANLDAQDIVTTDRRVCPLFLAVVFTASSRIIHVPSFIQSHSPALSHRQSISKPTSGENVRVSISVDTIKQQLSDGLQSLAEFKKSLRPSSDVQWYDEAVGSFEGAAKSLATLKNKLSNRRLAGNVNRASYVLPPPDLKLDFESDAPFGSGIPGIEESQKEIGLGVVRENKETEEQEQENVQPQSPHLGLHAF
jgi:uncharacterized membrane protein YfbV (UPF0208 family)